MIKNTYRQVKVFLTVGASNLFHYLTNDFVSDFDRRLKWTVDDVADILERENLHLAAKAFKEHGIDGRHLDCDTAELMGHLLGEDKIQLEQLNKLLKKLPPLPPQTNRKCQPKIVNDPVHGHIVLEPLCVAIIDTPQFQRMRYLKQLGSIDYVYPGGSHSRFEHSLGVCYLAGVLVKHLQVIHAKELNITREDVMCVQIAGLCHDLGHGPFSHLFDNKFIAAVRPDYKWKHDKCSIDMLDHMFRDPANKLVTKFRAYGLKTRDYIFIKEQIYSPVSEDRNQGSPKKEWPYKGRPRSKGFLYEIVANSRNGIDVDKWDYLARDCHHLGVYTSFDHTRLIHFARVVEVNGEKQICLRDKEAYNVYEMYHMRLSLHRWVCQHRVAAAIDIMLVEALKKANEVIKLPGKDGKGVKISDCIDDMEAFSHLTDNIFHQILLASEENLTAKDRADLRAAKEILLSIQRRQLYPCLYQSPPLAGTTFSTAKDAEASLLQSLTKEEKDSLQNLFFVQVVSMDFGQQELNPLLNLYFYAKDNPYTCRRFAAREVSHLVPQKQFREQIVRVFINNSINDISKSLLLKAISDFRFRNEKNGYRDLTSK